MESYLSSAPYDLITPDGRIESLRSIGENRLEAVVLIEKIHSNFVGFDIDPALVFFNIKSSLAQLGIDGLGIDCELDPLKKCARVIVHLKSIGRVGHALLPMLSVGMYIGKLFAADDRRRVRDPEYLNRMFGRADRWGNPLLSLGGMEGTDKLVLEKTEGRTVAYLTLNDGIVTYDEAIFGFLSTVAKALKSNHSIRPLLRLHQQWHPEQSRLIQNDEILLVRTQPLRIRTVFGMVVPELLAPGYQHTSARVLEPDRNASGDIYELFGHPGKELNDIPLEFYTLEPHREHIFFSDRDQLQTCLEDPQTLFHAFSTAPDPKEHLSAVFVVKGTQLMHLKTNDWISRHPRMLEFPGMLHNTRQALMVERYIQSQPQYPFLKAIEEDLISSQGVLFSYYFPSPIMKRLLLSDHVQTCLKGIYFQRASFSWGSYFSQEDRALLNDLAQFAIPVYWVDEMTGKVLQYVQKVDHGTGMFVPLNQVDHYLKSTVFGIYGSNLLEGKFENELFTILSQVLAMRSEMTHPLLNQTTPLALITGGGPGAMAVGNRVAQNLNILSCGNIVDFRNKGQAVINEQRQNPHVEAKMTYRLDKLVERQSEFNLDFAIFLEGGVGTDFEFALEEVRRKVGSTPAYPIILIGKPDYWTKKITSRYQCNVESGTIAGSEWLSNCFYCVEHAAEAIEVYRRFFSDTLEIGPLGPVYKEGFCHVAKEFKLN
ncbi:MAG: hypothetical protein JHC93_06665 [Parachlamydiales bacterium]|nr:hypothetical protein [Parachlamydiales bacterium]